MTDAPTRATSKKSANSIVGRVIRKFVLRRWTLVWLHRDLAQEIPGTVRLSRRAVTHKVVPITVESLDRLHPYFAGKLGDYRRLLQLGARGTGAEDRSGVIYALMWISTGDLFDDLYYRCWFRIDSGEVLQFAGEIVPDRRGGLAAVRVQREVWNEMLGQGYERAVCVIETDNARSLSMHFSLGFSEKGMITEVYRFFRVFSVVRHRRYQGPRFAERYVRKISRECTNR